MTARCPSALELEVHLLDPARSPIAAHVEGCERCRAELAEMRRVGDEFRREVFPATVDAVVLRSRRRRPPRWLFAAVPLGAAAAAALLVLVVRPPPGYVGLKGAGLGLTVYVSAGGAAQAVRDGDRVPAAAAIRFQVRPARPCRLWIVSVDGAGEVSRLFPPSGDSAAEVEAPETLPGGAVLDGRAGPERLYAVCSLAPLPYGEVESAAHAAGSGGAASVRSARALRGLPRDAAQATVLLEKRP